MADLKLVIVESPTKAKTIRKYLGAGYEVLASMGHVRDLPASAAEIPKDVKEEKWARLGVNVEDNFEPLYVIPRGKKKIVTEIKKALKKSSVLYLATDEDREGEAIGWHLVQLLNPKVPIKRMVFHEITKDAIMAALDNPREINANLVKAQEARRILDRLVGYTVSPLLWRKVAPKLSAGRVQSAAVRLLVLRERERMAFVSAEYWDLKAKLEKSATEFDAVMTTLDGKRLASGKDFDEKTGKLLGTSKSFVLKEKEAKALQEELTKAPFEVSKIERRETKRSPAPPFTTSTLQQDANRKLGMGARRTMQVAQKLYENGHITYMRTDSVHLADEALKCLGVMIDKRFGKEYNAGPKKYNTKSKGAQEAHEAIRPAGSEMATAEELGLSAEEAKVYDLIWKRTVASQMADAKLAFTTATIEAKGTKHTGTFRASGKEVLFPGFFKAYVEGKDDAAAIADDKNQPLPSMDEGETVPSKQIEALKHATKPPARFTEASLVKALEAAGIGRPSTYASIIDTIQRRGYVQNKNKQLCPTFISMAVIRLLEETLEPIVDLSFTAGMEEKLDAIAEGKGEEDFLKDFYRTELVNKVEAAMEVDPREICTIKQYGDAELRVGRWGPFLEMTEAENENQRVSLPADVSPSEVDAEYIEKLVAMAKKSKEPLGVDPETKENVYLLVGPYGPYVQRGEASKEKGAPKPKRVSIPKHIEPTTVDFALALSLLGLPRLLGVHPDTKQEIHAGLGRFGPYVALDEEEKKKYASLKPEDDVLTVLLSRAVELLNAKKTRKRGSSALKEYGEHPDGGLVRLMEGPYGVYIKWDKVNAGLPEGLEQDKVTLEKAVEIVNLKAEEKGIKRTKKKKAAPKKKATKKKTATKKATTKKTATKKTAAKKTTAKKTTAKKTTAKKATTKKAAPKKAAAKKTTAKKKTATKPAVTKRKKKTDDES